MIHDRIASGRWTRAGRGVYVISGAPDSWVQKLHAAIAHAGDGSAVSHRAAATLYGLARFPRLIEITTPRYRRYRSREVVVHTSTRLPEVDIGEVDSLWVTTPARTLVDLGAVAHPDRVEEALDVALRERLTTKEEVEGRLATLRGRGRRGAGVLAAILESRSEQSIPESRYERIFVREVGNAGLPPPELQYDIYDRGRFLARADAAWPDRRLVVEIDGHRYHATRNQRRNDSVRENALKLAGWQVLRFTTDQVWEERETVVMTVARALSGPFS